MDKIYALTLLFVASFSWAQDANIPKNPLKIEPVKETLLVEKNKPIHIQLHLSLPPGYTAYVEKFNLSNTNEFEFKNLRVSPSFQFQDKFTKKQKVGVKGRFVADFDLQYIGSEKSSSPLTKTLNLKYQACTEEFCLLPQKAKFEFNYKPPASQLSWDFMNISFDRIQQQKGFVLFLLIFLAGILTSLTPCIFPMIPITLSILGSQSLNKSKRASFGISVVYVFGIATTYSILGYISATTGTFFGAALSKPWVVISISLIFYFMALSMFDLFEIKMPTKLENSLMHKKLKPGLWGIFVAGLIAGIVAGPCVGPILVGLLTFVAQLKDPIYGFALLWAYAMGLGMIFIVLGTSSQLINKLPKAGPWMNFIKFIFGASLMGVALYYIESLFGNSIYLICLGISLLLICYIYGMFRKDINKHHILVGLLIIAFLAGIVSLGTGIRNTFVNVSSAHKQMGPWQKYTKKNFEKALQSGSPILIDFYADWCGACKELEKFTFSDPQVQHQFQRFTLLKVDATLETEEISKTLNQHNVMGLPTIQVYSKDGNLRKDLVLTGFESAEDFVKRLKKVK